MYGRVPETIFLFRVFFLNEILIKIADVALHVRTLLSVVDEVTTIYHIVTNFE